MPPQTATTELPPPVGQKKPLMRYIVLFIVVVLAAYMIIAYVALPWFWKVYVRHHPALEDIPRVARTVDGIPGDPLNVALIGTEEQVKQILQAAGWHPADPLGLRSDLKIAADTVLKRPYDDAPVSRLFLFGRVEDLAFEKPVGNDPRRRHHVRWWRSEKPDADGRPGWIGAATFDQRVGFSHTTGEITHHIAADVDAERDGLFADFERTGQLVDDYFVVDFHTTHSGRNGGGDPWHTDGRLRVGVINQE